MGVPKIFFKKSVDGSRTFPYSTIQSEKERVMVRWAQVTTKECSSIWVNENHVLCIKDYGTGGCILEFAEEETQVREEVDDIFSAWDDWQNIHKDS